MPKSTAVVNTNLGLYLDRAIIDIAPGALQDGNNFRIFQGKLSNINIGWSSFGSFTLNGAVTLIATMHLRSGTSVLVFGTPTDLYSYSTAGGGTISYITPRYATGTAAASGTAVTGTGTAWNTGTPTNAKVGDEISFGSNARVDPAATWYRIDAVGSDTGITLHTSAGTVVDGPYTIRKKFTATAANMWHYDTFVNAQPSGEDRLYLTNAVDPPMQWNGTANQVTVLNSLGFTCNTLCVYKNMLVYGGIVQGGTRKPTDIINSDVSSPEEIAAGLASQFKVGGTTDEIWRIARLGDYLVIYLEKLVILANFVGDPLVFVFRVGVDGKGLSAGKGLATYPNYHEFVGPDTLYAFDGSQAKETSNHVWREIIRQSDPLRKKNYFTVLDETHGDYIWSVPLNTDPGAGTITSPNSTAYAEHYLETVPKDAQIPYSKRSFPFTAAGTFQRQTTLTWDQLTAAWNTYNFRWNDQFFAAAFPQVIVGDANGKIWVLNGGQDANGTAMASYVKYGRKAVIDGENRGVVSRVIPFSTKFSNSLTVTVNLADFAIGPATIAATSTFDQSQPEGLFFASIYRAGRFMDLQFGTPGPAQPYEISGYDVKVLPGGKR